VVEKAVGVWGAVGDLEELSTKAHPVDAVGEVLVAEPLFHDLFIRPD
jgi:hypothetical protein